MNALKKISKSPVSLLNFQPWCGQSLRLTWLVHYLHHLAHDLAWGRCSVNAKWLKGLNLWAKKISVKSNVFVRDKEITIFITLCIFKESLYVQERSEHLWSWQLPIFRLSAPLFILWIELMGKIRDGNTSVSPWNITTRRKFWKLMDDSWSWNSQYVHLKMTIIHILSKSECIKRTRCTGMFFKTWCFPKVLWC